MVPKKYYSIKKKPWYPRKEIRVVVVQSKSKTDYEKKDYQINPQ